jgi:hypothetical protein
VAEHLEPKTSQVFVQFLTDLSDVVLFGAAYTNQGGTNHINEQKHSYWAGLFSDRGYKAYDLFRPLLWGDMSVEYWYQQNTYLYVRSSSPVCKVFAESGVSAISNTAFMNCVHPMLFDALLGALRGELDWYRHKERRSRVRKIAELVLPQSIIKLISRKQR